jgi:hypothetical protein
MKSEDRPMTRSLVSVAALACAILTPPLAGRAHGAAPQAIEPGRHVLEGPEVAIYNIAGEMRIVSGTGSSVVVEVDAQGRDARRLTVEERTENGIRVLRVVYPEDRIVYPQDGYGPDDISSTSYGDRRIRVRGKGPGLEAHADIRVLVPRGKRVHAHLMVGRGFITDVSGEISFEGASSTLQAEKVSGALVVDVGSGDIHVSRSSARIATDTGSGNVTITEIDGNISADSGSGNVSLKRVGAEKIALDAGSGSITGSEIQTTTLSADCGSGEIDLSDTAASELVLDAGSGSVHLRLTKNVDKLAIEAGSGSVRVEAPSSLSARFRIECPKRQLHIDFPTEIQHGDDDVTVGTIGSGRGSIAIEAGSGSVHLVRM